MIPAGAALISQGFEVVEQPTLTYKMDIDNGVVRGDADGLEAMEQAIYKILSTERYQYVMYPWDYGIELDGLYGEPVSYVCPELERRIKEALLWDTRIEKVKDFKFDTSKKGIVYVEFTACTIFGDADIGKEVAI